MARLYLPFFIAFCFLPLSLHALFSSLHLLRHLEACIKHKNIHTYIHVFIVYRYSPAKYYTQRVLCCCCCFLFLPCPLAFFTPPLPPSLCLPWFMPPPSLCFRTLLCLNNNMGIFAENMDRQKAGVAACVPFVPPLSLYIYRLCKHHLSKCGGSTCLSLLSTFSKGACLGEEAERSRRMVRHVCLHAFSVNIVWSGGQVGARHISQNTCTHYPTHTAFHEQTTPPPPTSLYLPFLSDIINMPRTALHAHPSPTHLLLLPPPSPLPTCSPHSLPFCLCLPACCRAASAYLPHCLTWRWVVGGDRWEGSGDGDRDRSRSPSPCFLCPTAMKRRSLPPPLSSYSILDFSAFLCRPPSLGRGREGRSSSLFLPVLLPFISLSVFFSIFPCYGEET